MYNSTERRLDPSKEFLLIRHGQDNDVLDTELNQPLISDLLDQIDPIISCIRKMISTKITLKIVYGPSRRTTQTAQHLAEVFSRLGYVVNLEEDIDIKEFYQGQFRIDHSLLADGKYVPLETAWKIFNHKVASGEIHYRFGDPIVDDNGKPTFPLLQGFFVKYGETQSDFLIRIRHFISKISYGERFPNHLFLVITHQAVASRIQREITENRVQLGYCEGVFVPYPSI